MTPSTVLIADDHPVYRHGLRDLLDPPYSVVAEAGSGAEAVALAAAGQPHLVVMDLRMSGLDGIAATRDIKSAAPATRVVVNSALDDDEDVIAALQAGADGYALEDEEPVRRLHALGAALQGEIVLPALIAKRVLPRGAWPADRPRPRMDEGPIALTAREMAVLRLVAQGRRHREISRALRISERTVANHVEHIYGKARVYDQAQAILYAIKVGILPL